MTSVKSIIKKKMSRIMKRKLLTLLLLISSRFAMPVFSQEKTDSIASMDEVTVTATRRSTQSSKLPYSIAVLSREDASRQLSRTVPESLTGIPGVFIQKTNHAGGSPFLRGLTGNQTLILVDGIRLNNSIFRYGPNQYMTLIDPFIVEKVEVVKGTGSVQYGSDAMTGVINIQTTALTFREKPQWNEKASMRLTESGMEFSFRPELKYEGRKFAFMLGASNKKFGDLKGGDSTGFQVPSAYAEKSFDFKWMSDLGKGWQLTGAYQWLQQTDVPVYHRYKLENFALNTSDPIGRGLGYLQLKKTFKSNHFRSLDIFVAHQRIAESRFSRRKNTTVTRFERDRISTVSAGIDLSHYFNAHWNANTGIELNADEVQSERKDNNAATGVNTVLRGLYPDGARYANVSAYTLHHFQFGKLQLEAGMRYNRYTATINEATLGKVSLRPDALVFQGGANYELLKAVYLYANISDGFRAPNIDDLGTLGIVDFRYEVPAYALKPERSVNNELGIKYLRSKLSGSLSIFRTTLYNLITRVKTAERISGYDVYIKENVDKGFIRGWEAQIAYKPMKWLRTQISATNLYGQSITKNQPLRRIPPFNSRMSAEYLMNQFVAGISFDHASPQRRLEAGDKSDNRIPVGGTPGFNLLNIHAAFQANKLSFRLYLNNIFNVDYRTHGSGINGIGRSISAMMVVSLKQ
jgi:outer membrane receptor protein involved in Fe transport